MLSWLRNIFVPTEDVMKNNAEKKKAEVKEAASEVKEAVKETVKEAVAVVHNTADINKDGKVDKEDVKAAAAKVKTTVKSKAIKAKK